jgi:predicted transcriptional regulator
MLLAKPNPPELEAKLTRLAAETGRTADQVAIDLLASSVDYDNRFRGEVEKGRASARERRLLEHDDVVARHEPSAIEADARPLDDRPLRNGRTSRRSLAAGSRK